MVHLAWSGKRERRARRNFAPGATMAMVVLLFGATLVATSGPAMATSVPTAAPSAGSPAALSVNGVAPFHASGPRRVLDSRAATRIGPYSTPFTSGAPRAVTVAGTGDVPTGAMVVVANVTVASPSDRGFATVYSAGQVMPNASNLNFGPGQNVANQVTVPVGANGAWSIIVAGATAHVLVDVTGWYGGTTGDSYHPRTPTRILDTRPASRIGPYSTPFTSGVTRPVTVTGVAAIPPGATAVVANITVNATAAGFLSLWPAGSPWPATSNLNFSAGQIVSNQVTIPVGANGAWSVVAGGGPVHIVIDVAGWYDPNGGDSLGALPSPTRLLDTRPAFNVGPYSTPFTSPNSRDLTVSGGSSPVPAGADSVTLNVTITNPSAAGFVMIWPAGSARPLASVLNFTAGATVANAVTVKTGDAGAISILVAGATADLLVDAFAWHAPPATNLVAAGGAAFMYCQCGSALTLGSTDGGLSWPTDTHSSRSVISAYLKTPAGLVMTAGDRTKIDAPFPLYVWTYTIGRSANGLTQTSSASPGGVSNTISRPVRTTLGSVVAPASTSLFLDTPTYLVMRSVDDGQTFTTAGAPNMHDLQTVGPTLIALDSTGTHLVRSTDDGVTWITDTIATSTTFTHLLGTPAGLLASNASGQLSRSTDLGNTWTVIGQTTNDLTRVTVVGSRLVGPTGWSDDGGATWVAPVTAVACETVSRLVETPAGVIAVGSSTEALCVARSNDEGTTWTTTTIQVEGANAGVGVLDVAAL